MGKLEELIAQKAYELDCLRTFKNIVDSGDCNDCALKRECEIVPKAGQLVRYNCYKFSAENQCSPK